MWLGGYDHTVSNSLLQTKGHEIAECLSTLMGCVKTGARQSIGGRQRMVDVRGVGQFDAWLRCGRRVREV